MVTGQNGESIQRRQMSSVRQCNVGHVIVGMLFSFVSQKFRVNRTASLYLSTHTHFFFFMVECSLEQKWNTNENNFTVF